MRAIESMDVTEIYRMIAGASPEKLEEIKLAAVHIGHMGLIDAACERLGKAPDMQDLSDALWHAIRQRGYTIDDTNTSVGELYQRLFGTDFKMLNYTFKVDDGLSFPVSYDCLPRSVKDNINKAFLASRHYFDEDAYPEYAPRNWEAFRNTDISHLRGHEVLK